MSKTPELTPLKSSALTGYHYDQQTRTLTVRYTNGGMYSYADVPMDKAEAFSGAASPGGFFAAKIRNNHTATKL